MSTSKSLPWYASGRLLEKKNNKNKSLPDFYQLPGRYATGRLLDVVKK